MTKTQINRREVLLRKLDNSLKKKHSSYYDSYSGSTLINDKNMFTDGFRIYLLNNMCSSKTSKVDIAKIQDALEVNTNYKTIVNIKELKEFIKETKGTFKPYILKFEQYIDVPTDKTVNIIVNPVYLLEMLEMFNTNEVYYNVLKSNQVFIYGLDGEMGTLFKMIR